MRTVRIIVAVLLVALILLGFAGKADSADAPIMQPSQQIGQSQQAPPLLPDLNFDEEDVYWLSRIVSAEARGEPFRGQLAVANVVLNRVANDGWPNTIKDVIFDAPAGMIQFQPVANGSIYDEPTASATEAALLAIAGKSVIPGDVVYFYNPDIATDQWIRGLPIVTKIGGHVFCTP